jgi:hypothetical protein
LEIKILKRFWKSKERQAQERTIKKKKHATLYTRDLPDATIRDVGQ